MTKKPDPTKASHAGYHSFKSDDGDQYGSFEVFYDGGGFSSEDEPAELSGEGWYWWACFPGCLPDGEPCGPFTSSRAAYRDAREG